MQKQKEEYNARKRKSLEQSAADDSNVVNAKLGAGEHGGGAGSGKSPAPGTGSVGSALNAKPGADGHGGGAGSGNSLAPRAANDSNVVNAGADAGGRGGGAGSGNSLAPRAGGGSNAVIEVFDDSSEEGDNDVEIVVPKAGEHGGGADKRKLRASDTRGDRNVKTRRNYILRLFDPSSGGGVDLELARLDVDVSGSNNITIEVKTKIELSDLYFHWSDTIQCIFGDKTAKTFTIEPKDGTRFQTGTAYVYVEHISTNTIIGTVHVSNHTQTLPHSSQNSADIDPGTQFATQGLPDDASKSASKRPTKE
jgi:hypothetical protein